MIVMETKVLKNTEQCRKWVNNIFGGNQIMAW